MKTSGETVIFLHIPKTGGTTLHHILDECYPRHQICSFEDANRGTQIENFKNLAPEKREAYRLIEGHLSFGFHRYVPGPSTYITFLREPIARALSFYHYAKSQRDHYLYALLNDDQANLKTVLSQQNATNHEFFNLQTSMIAGDEWVDAARPADRAALERAKQNLRDHFRFAGLTEDFDASLRRLSRDFGWKVGSYRKRNVTRRKPDTEIDAETRELLREANALDIELYQFACELFHPHRRGDGNG